MQQSLSILLLCICFLGLSLGQDRIVGENNCKVLIDGNDRAAMFSRNFIGGQSNRWPNGIVPYTISSSFSSAQRQVIMDSMKHISDRTCVQFVARTNQRNYVDIFTGEQGCYANLGYNQNRARSVVHLQSNGCVFLGIVVHELLHILGFGHEHTRSDRNQFVQINWSNIRGGTHSNFWRALGETESASIPYCGSVEISQYDQCHAGFRASTFGQAYDYGSVMHYGLNFFSTNGQNTISLRRQTSVRIPNRSGMSALDVEKTKAAYNCQGSASTAGPSSTVSTTTSSCQDRWSYCDRYTRLCGAHPFINKYCKKTCFNCVCENNIDDGACSTLKSFCRYSFISRNCAKECGAC
eukprot:TRINITY_DN303_c0_g1_i13.p1 TRINITY_DN303_c0_g1~~TRINITY_DN303_c0_g1_i13.p1  ORF type:complete len:352 (+),score=27.12 TRINITY_DN303_c0_g1_i13:325-1380(+)